MILELKPSDILYSQDSISKQFSCGILYIGDTLDQLLLDSFYIQKIQKIHVVERNGTLFSMDNRRLWVFKKAEEFGCFEKVAVIRTRKFNRNKFTTKNGGTSIRVRGDPGGNIWKTWSPVHIRDTHDHDDLNKSSLRVQDPPVRTISRYKTDTIVTSGNNDGNEDDTRNALYTSSRYRTTESLFEDTDNWNITLRSPDPDSYVHGSLKGRSNSKCVYEAMDKTPSYAWENTRKGMENEISKSSSPVFTRTSTFSRKVMDNEISETYSPVFTRTSTASRKVMDNEISESSSPDFTRTSKFSRKVMDNEISESSSPVFTRTSTVSKKEMDNEISESSSPVFTRTSTVSRKVMDNEISESSSPGFTRTSTVSRKVMDNEISETSSPVFKRALTVSRKVMDNEISESSSPDFTRTSKFSRKVMDNEISESSSPVFTRTSTDSKKEMDNEISESSSPVFTRTSTVSRKVMDNEISESSSPGFHTHINGLKKSNGQ